MEYLEFREELEEIRDVFMNAIIVKTQVLNYLLNNGFHYTSIGRYKYQVNYRFRILIKYSQIFFSSNRRIIRFSLTESLFRRHEIDFILFIIQNPNNVLVAPLEIMQDIDHYVNLALSNRNYNIHIDPENFYVHETPWNLNIYLNDFEQLLCIKLLY